MAGNADSPNDLQVESNPLAAHPLRRHAFDDVAVHAAQLSSHVAAILLTDGGEIIDCDVRGECFLQNGKVLRVSNGHLHFTDPVAQPRFVVALQRTVRSGRAANLLVSPLGCPEQRFSLILVRMHGGEDAAGEGHGRSYPDILCVVAPLDRRRFATARQLMELFGLSAAEARLTRALCHGDSLDSYACEQGLKLPTVRTQLRSVLAKTGTGRQAALIRLIAGIPVIRETRTRHQEAARLCEN